jgi:hypothetical protein
MPWIPGQSGNPKGQKPGWSTFKKSTVLKDLAGGRNRVDALKFLCRVVRSSKFGIPARIQAAGLILPYQHPRVTARFIREKIELPAPKSVGEAMQNIALLGELGAAGKIGLDEMADLTACQRSYVEAKTALDTEERLLALERALERLTPAVDVIISGGLPPLPGADVILPQLNGAPGSPISSTSPTSPTAPLPPGDDEPSS